MVLMMFNESNRMRISREKSEKVEESRGGSNLSSARLGLCSNKDKSSVKARLEVGSILSGSKKARIIKSSKK